MRRLFVGFRFHMNPTCGVVAAGAGRDDSGTVCKHMPERFHVFILHLVITFSDTHTFASQVMLTC